MTDWSVYLLRCRDGTLYTGIATDVRRRLEEGTPVIGFGLGAQILYALGLRQIRLLSSAPRRHVALDGYGLHIDSFVPLED